MNILFFLTPKSDVVYIDEDASLRHALDKMERHRYAAVPIISRQGQYVGTLTEGDLLWYIRKQPEAKFREADRIQVTEVPRRSDNKPVRIDSRMEDLLDKAIMQNFVPVLDDQKSFIGIVTRRDIMKYIAKNSDDMKK